MRNIKVAAAQLGPIQKADTRQAVVARMLELMRQAEGCDLIVYPELALTTFFPRWHDRDRGDADIWFEREMPSPAIRPLFEEAKRTAMAMSFGYAEVTPDGHHFNTSILVDRSGTIVGKYRKVHLPGHDEFDPQRSHQHLEKRYFEPGDLGFPAWRMLGGVFGMCICNDRRWPETFRVLGLQGVEMVVLGFYTPSVNAQNRGEGSQSACSTTSFRSRPARIRTRPGWWPSPSAASRTAITAWPAPVIVNPDGEIVAETTTEDDELLAHDCDLDATRFGKQSMFDFARHRRIEHYGVIATQTGIVPPKT